MTDSNDDACLVSADDALVRLMDGNARFLRGELRITGATLEEFADLAKGQRPFATILGCSDSRVPPELLFNAGFGDLFVIRVAGNVLSPQVAGSLPVCEHAPQDAIEHGARTRKLWHSAGGDHGEIPGRTGALAHPVAAPEPASWTSRG